MDPVDLTTERLILRPVAEADVATLRSIRRSGWVSQWWGPGDDEPQWPLDADETERCYSIWCDGSVVGFIQFYEVISPSVKYAGIDLFLSDAASHQGLGREAVTRVMRHLVDDLGHHRIVIDPSAQNARAIATYEACGFTKIGIMREYERNVDGHGWHDGVFMEYVVPR